MPHQGSKTVPPLSFFEMDRVFWQWNDTGTSMVGSLQGARARRALWCNVLFNMEPGKEDNLPEVSDEKRESTWDSEKTRKGELIECE